MVEGVREQAIARHLVDSGTWEKGIRDLHRTTEQDGTFCYTFFKATGNKEYNPQSFTYCGLALHLFKRFVITEFSSLFFLGIIRTF